MCFTTPWRASKNDNNLQFKEQHGQLNNSLRKTLHVPIMDLLCSEGLTINIHSSRNNLQH